MANLQEHSQAVNSLTPIGDGKVFVSVGEDCCARVWNVDRSVDDHDFSSVGQLKTSGGRLLSSCVLQKENVAIGSSNGHVSLHNVEREAEQAGEHTQPMTGIHASDKGVIEVREQANLLFYASEKGFAAAYDPRAGQTAFEVGVDLREGMITSTTGPGEDLTWFVVGTELGYMGLWDTRFLVRPRKWRHPLGCRLGELQLSSRSAPHPQGRANSSATPLLWASAGPDEVGLWSCFDGSCRQASLAPFSLGSSTAWCMASFWVAYHGIWTRIQVLRREPQDGEKQAPLAMATPAQAAYGPEEIIRRAGEESQPNTILPLRGREGEGTFNFHKSIGS